MDWAKLFFLRWFSSGHKEGDQRNSLRIEKRRGQRVPATLPVFVYGRIEGEPFAEQTETTNISAQGGLVALSVELSPSQTLLVTNLQTNEDLACRVARMVKTKAGKTLVGVEFLHSCPRFWTIDFSS
jgi:hypothetical protein